MTRLKLIVITTIFIIVAGLYFGLIKKESLPFYNQASDINKFNQSQMKIKSSAFSNNEKIPYQYTCDGENVSPPLMIENVPSKAKSLVLIVEDPDAATGNFVHWLIWNINPLTKNIIQKEPPKDAIVGKNDFGKNEYGGPCPPQGTHDYQFKLYALDILLDLDPNKTNKQNLEKAIANHILDQSVLVGLYKR